MNREENVKSFEELMSRVNREGKDALMDYIRKSDFIHGPGFYPVPLKHRGRIIAA